MGDEIYPGVLFHRLHPEIKVSEITEFIFSVFGEGKGLYRNGGLEVTICNGAVNRNARAVVSGLLLSYNVIRAKIARKKIKCVTRKGEVKEWYAFVSNVDFGLPRMPDGDLEHHNLMLHNHMKDGKGMRDVLNIFTDDFVKDVGPLKELSTTVYLNELDADIRFFHGVGKLLYDGTTSGRGEQGENWNYEVTEAHFMYRWEALQAYTALNGNPAFSEKRGKFIISSNQKLCPVSENFGLGHGDKVINIQNIVQLMGYVPFDVLCEGIICPIKKDVNLATVCFRCDEPYELLGLGPDINWVAAKCGCETAGSPHVWHKESFFRLILPQTAQKIYLKKDFDEIETSRAKDKLVRLIPPVKTLYESVEDFNQTALTVAKSSFTSEKRELHGQKVRGTVSSLEALDFITMKGKQRQRTRVQVTVPESPLWSAEGTLRIQSVTLIPLEVDETFGKDGITYKQVKNNWWKKGTLEDISRNSEDASQSIVTIIIPLSSEATINLGSECQLIPKPPKTEKEGLRRAVSLWQAGVNAKDGQGTSFIGDVSYGHKMDVEVQTRNDTHVWSLQLSIKNASHLVRKYTDRLHKVYMGAEINIEGCAEAKRCTGRVVELDDEDDGYAYVELIIMLPASVTIEEDVGCSIRFWVIVKYIDSDFERVRASKKDGRMTVRLEPANAIPAGAEEDYYGDEDDVEFDFGDEPQTNDYEAPNFIDEYVDDELVIASLGGINSTLAEWRVRPSVDVSGLDILLYESDADGISHDFTVTPTNTRQPIMQDTINHINEILNESQKKSVENFLNLRYSLTRGPPGTGKTATATFAAGILFCKETGIMVYAAASNYAVNEAMIKMQDVKKGLIQKMHITRMLSEKRELKMLKESRDIPDDQRDMTYLHEQVRTHSAWRTQENQRMLRIYRRRFSPTESSYVTKAEKDQLTAFIKNLAVGIIARSDIVFTTLTTANDSRLESALSLCAQRKRGLAALFIDEASVVEVTSIMPLLRFNAARTFSLGDERQLSSIVQDESAKAAGLDVSWMDHLLMHPSVSENDAVCMLEEQYRMYKPIGDIVSDFMYNGIVRAAPPVLQRDYSKVYAGVYRSIPEMANKNLLICTYNHYGERRQHNSPSINNPTEIAIMRDILRTLQSARVNLETVTIISMYDSQVRHVGEMLESMGPGFVGVKNATVDSYMGKEGEIFIISTVRSNKSHNIGFLRDSRRLNVALSRSKAMLFIISDLKTLWKTNLPNMQRIVNIWKKHQVPVKTYRLVDGRTQPHNMMTLNDYMLGV